MITEADDVECFYRDLRFADELAEEYRKLDSEGLTAEAAAMWRALKMAVDHFGIPRQRYEDCFMEDGRRR